MRRWVILPVPLLLFLLVPSPAAPEHESCVGVTSRFFRQGLNFFVDGERKAVEEVTYPVSPSSLVPGGLAGFAGVVRTPDDAAVAAARVSWSHD